MANKTDPAATVDAYMAKLGEAAKGKETTIDQKIKIGHILVKWLAVKKGIPDEAEGSAWEESA